MRISALAVSLVVIATAWAVAFPQPSLLGEGVSDVAYDGQLYISSLNGTLVAYSNGATAWKLTLEGYGAPALLVPAPPYGLLVLTDTAWLGLITRDGKTIGWVKVDVDPNMISRGRGRLLYSNGLALIYAGATASAVRVPELRQLGHFSIKNSFLGGSISPYGDRVLLYGFNTLCYICIQNEEKLVLVVKPETGEQIYSGVVNQLRDATVLWRRNWLVLARWDAMYVYDLRETEKPVRVYAYPHSIDRWLSWGFSPSGNLFHYVIAEGGSLNVVVIDVESGSITSKGLPVAPARRVLSLLDDNYGLAVVSYNTPVEAAYVLFGNLVGEQLVETVKDLGAPKTLKTQMDRAIAIFSGGFVVLPPLPRSIEERDEPPSACFRVVVADEEGQPYKGAVVCVNASCVATSTDGTATFMLKEGMYTLTVRHTLAGELQTTVLVQGNTTKLVTLPRRHTLNINVSSFKEALGSCTIRVRDAQGNILGEVDNCTALFTLAKGVYTVEVEAAQRRIRRSIAVQSDTVLHFILAENERAMLTVSALDENGTLLSDANIYVLDQRNTTVASSRGRLAFQLAPGRYTIQVQRPGYLNWSSTIELNGSLNLEVKMTRFRLESPAEERLNWAAVIAAPAVSSLAAAAVVVAGYRFKLADRLRRLVSQTRLKPRTRRK